MSVDTSFFRSHTSQVFRARGLARGVLLTLADRGLDVSNEVRERIESCEDPELLETWVVRAWKIERAEDIFGDESV